LHISEYIQSDKYGTSKKALMQQAIMAYRNGDVGLNAASRTYGVPKATLKTRTDGGSINAVNRVQAFGRSIDIRKKHVDDLSKHVLLLDFFLVWQQ
jgi:hypothetical protein